MHQHARVDFHLLDLRSLGRTLFLWFCSLVSISMALFLLCVLVGLSLFVTGFLAPNG
jgi:hypothetical protein